MTQGCRTKRLRWVAVLAAAAVVVLAGSAGALAQSVPVTVEVQSPEQPTAPTEPTLDEPTSPTSEPPGDDPSTTERPSPAPPPGEEPPPAAADPPPDEPLARTGADVLRTVRDAAALLAAGVVLLIATRKPERTAR